MNGAKRHIFGFGLLYLMANFPFVWWVKIGITGVGVLKRAKNIDIDMPGVPVPVAFVPAPFVYQIEQTLHDLCSPIRCRFYRGSGHTEWFWFPAAAPALVVIGGVWAGYVWLVDYYAGTRIFETIISTFL